MDISRSSKGLKAIGCR